MLYAPNAFEDPRGRVLMLAWLQELRDGAGGGFDYAGCLSLPRVLTVQGGSQSLFMRNTCDQLSAPCLELSPVAPAFLCTPWMKVYRVPGCRTLLSAVPLKRIYPRVLRYSHAQ